jgi:hypothetical protein
MATFALKAGEWFRRGRLFMVSPGSQAPACPWPGLVMLGVIAWLLYRTAVK